MAQAIQREEPNTPGDLPPFLGKPHVQLGLALMLD